MTFLTLRRLSALVLCGCLALLLSAGCSRGPSQTELGVLEETEKATLAAEQQVAEKKATKAKLERKVAEKQAEMKAWKKKKAGTTKNLAKMSGK